MTAKLHTDMSIVDYHSKTELLSKSMLSVFADCPARFKYKYIDGGAEKPTKSLRIGNAVHVLALEPELWVSGYHVLPETYFNDKGEEKPFRKDERMQVYKDEISRAGDRIILSREEFNTVESMAEALTKNAFALSLLKAPGYVEASILWDGFRCRPDFMRNDSLIVDLKTARSVKPSVFQKDAFNLHYALSVALTTRGYEALHGKKPDDYVFLCIEPEPPYLISCFNSFDAMDDSGISYLEYGEAELTKILAKYDECKATNIWPGYAQKIQPMKIPRWAMNKFMENSDDE